MPFVPPAAAGSAPLISTYGFIDDDLFSNSKAIEGYMYERREGITLGCYICKPIHMCRTIGTKRIIDM